jgi:gliding motility-associated-like protein
MKIFTALLCCFLPLFNNSLGAKPVCNTYSIAADTLLLASPVETGKTNNSPASTPSTSNEPSTALLLPTAFATGDFCGQNTGSIDLTPDPNTPGPWTYLWSTGATTQDITGLGAGTYTVFVTDANGDAQALQVVVTDLLPASPTGVNAVATGNTVCIGIYNGALDITVIPAVIPTWTYLWSTGATTQDISGLNSGTYTVTITYGLTCSTPYQFTVPDLAGSPVITLPQPNNGVDPSTCEMANGTAGVLVSGGVMPYTYLWSNGATTFFTQNVFAGTYTITVTGANGCTDTQSLTVDNVNWPISIDDALVIIVPNTTCIGGNGSISVPTVTPIIQGPYSYLWSNGETTQTITNLVSGSYRVTVSLNAACFDTQVYYVEDEPVVANLATTGTPTTCGFSNGFVNLTIAPGGGLAPYTYLWSNGATTQDLANVPADTYSVTVTGINACTTTGSTTLDDTPILFSYSAQVTDQFSCDTSNGQIALSLFPGTLSYQWSNGATTKILKNLAPGDYSVTISAGGTCTAVETYSVGDVTEYPSIPAASTASTCGLSNGFIDLSVLGNAEAPFTYQWSNGASTQDLSGIQADTFYVTVTSAVGCSKENIVIVPNVNDTLYVLANVTDNFSCALPTGNIALNITPIDSAYTFLWSGGQTMDSLSNLAAGTYLVTVTLGVSCIALDTFEVLNNALPPNLSVSGSSANCGLNNGAADLIVSSGTGPFIYLWSNAATTEDLTNLTPGTYSVTVTGANQCTEVGSVSVLNNNIPLNINGTPAGNTSCTAENGSIDVGVSPAGTYNYLWSNAATTEDLSNLASGTYTVTVSLGTCLSVTTFAVADNATAPSLSASSVSANCGLSDGSAALNVNSGTGPFSYLWSNMATTEDLTGLAPGNYSVTVTGGNNCTAVSAANVQNNNIALNVSSTPVGNSSCTAANGALDITVSPAGTYTYLWSNTASTEDLNNLNSGTYTVIVSLGSCQSTTIFSVADNTATPNLASNVTPAICSLNNGEIDLSVSGTAGPFTYLWSNMATTEDLNTLLPGNYSVTVTAPNGCTEVATLNVANNASNFSLAATAAPLTNCAANNGAINLNVTPAGVFTYLWSNAATTEDLNGLSPGTYTVSVTQSGSCTATASYFVLDQRTNPSSTQTIVPELCGQTDGSIDLNVSGGTLPYGYLWNGGQVSQDLNNLGSGTYTVTVTDANNCTVTGMAVLPGNSISFALAGTPSDNSSCLQNNGSVDLSVNPSGAFSYLWSNMATTEDLSGLNAGTYTVTVSAGGNCTNTAAFSILSNVPSPLIAPNIGAAFCGNSSGNIDLSISGSPAPFQFMWSNMATTEDLNGILSNTYSVTVTAANGCTTVDNFVVPENVFTPNIGSQLNASTSCIVSNGSIDLTITPALAYTYLWSNMATTEDLSNLAAGSYTVTVSGGGACTSTAILLISSTVPVPQLSDNIAAAICGQTNGIIDLSVAGSPAPYSFLWSNTATTEDLVNILSGTFTVTVTAANSCTSVGNYTVPENVLLPVIIGAPLADNSCVANNGSIDLTVGPATGYIFSWSNAATTEDLTSIPAGAYTVTVNGGGACIGTASFVVADQTTQPQAGIIAGTTALDCSNPSTILTGSITGTPNPGSFQWSINGNALGTSNNLPVSTPGLYELVVQDKITFCTASTTISITQSLNLPDLSIVQPELLTCVLPTQTLSGSSPVGGVQFTWATIIGTDTTILGNGPSFPVSAAGTYYLLGLNPANSCANAISVTVLANQNPPIANAGPPFTLDCAGETAALNGNGSGAPNLTYLWTSPDGHFVAGAGTASPLIDEAGTYQLLVTNPANGCTDTDLVTIEPEIPVAFASVVQPNCLHPKGRIQIDSVTGLSEPILYRLNQGQPAPQNEFTNLVPGIYTIDALGGNGCSATIEVVINPPVLLTLTLAPEATIILGYTYQINAQVNIPDADIAAVTWTPGDGLVCDTCLSTEAMPLTSTNYQVVVVSKEGCEARGNLSLIVDKTRHIYAPNIFAPDDDGRNDVFSIYGDPANVVKIKSLQVYSRWGEAVYERRDFDPGDTQTGWDGTFKGQRLDPAVFVWQALVLYIDGQETFFSGDVTLKR